MINVIGGTYRELDFDNNSNEIFGSGYRCTIFLLENGCKVNFTTSGNNETNKILDASKDVFEKFKYKSHHSAELITFQYNFSLDEPAIFPSPLKIPKTNGWKVKGEKVIAFGMLESDYSIDAVNVVFDPQSTIKPKHFSKIGRAKNLVYILNRNEAQSIASSNNIEDIKEFLFKEENSTAFIIKDGPAGAKLYTKSEEFDIPCYITDNVFKIGSGDIFTASFGFYWLEKGLPLLDSAILASKSTAFYSDKKAYVNFTDKHDFHFKEFKPKSLSEKQVYLASPFFALSELILVDKIRSALLSFGVKVFSPFHDIGIGNNICIAKKDIEGIENSDVIFVVLDNLDSGTLIESGISIAKGKPIIGYHRTCEESKLLMLTPGNFSSFNNLTTALYKTIWSL